MKYLVLGSSGQIGSPLVSYLKRRGHKVETFDIVDTNQEDLRIKDNPILTAKINKSDFVFFLAFDVGGARYLSKYQHTYGFINNNVEIMLNVFTVLTKTKKRFIFASSQMSEMSFSPYGVCKALGEKYTLSLGGVITRFWNVYGPESDLEKSHVITDFINMAIETGQIDMMTDGGEQRQFLYVDDCCKCLYDMSQNYDLLIPHKEYHITSYKWTTIYEIAKIISQIFGGIRIIPGTKKNTVQKNLSSEPNKNVLDFWEPCVELEAGINAIVEKNKEIRTNG